MAKLDILYRGIDGSYLMAKGTVEDILLRNSEDKRLHSLANRKLEALAGDAVIPLTIPERLETFAQLETVADPHKPLRFKKQMVVYEDNSFWPINVTTDPPPPEVIQTELDAAYEKFFQKAVAAASLEDMGGNTRTAVVVTGAVIAVLAVLLIGAMVIQQRFM